jgi:hypothetical protein
MPLPREGGGTAPLRLTLVAQERCRVHPRAADANLGPPTGSETVTRAMTATRKGVPTSPTVRIPYGPYWSQITHRCSLLTKPGAQIRDSEPPFRLWQLLRQFPPRTTHLNRARAAQPSQLIRAEGSASAPCHPRPRQPHPHLDRPLVVRRLRSQECILEIRVSARFPTVLPRSRLRFQAHFLGRALWSGPCLVR